MFLITTQADNQEGWFKKSTEKDFDSFTRKQEDSGPCGFSATADPRRWNINIPRDDRI